MWPTQTQGHTQWLHYPPKAQGHTQCLCNLVKSPGWSDPFGPQPPQAKVSSSLRESGRARPTMPRWSQPGSRLPGLSAWKETIRNEKKGKDRICEKAERNTLQIKKDQGSQWSPCHSHLYVGGRGSLHSPKGLGKPSFKPSFKPRPCYVEGDTVNVRAKGVQPVGKGYVVSARGEGAETVCDVTYLKGFDDCRCVLLKGSFLNGISEDLGMVWRDVSFKGTTKSPLCLPTGKGGKWINKSQKPMVAATHQTSPSEDPAEHLAEKLKKGKRREKGWLRKELGVREAEGKQLRGKEKYLFLSHHNLLKSRSLRSLKRMNPCMSRRVCALARRTGGCKVLLKMRSGLQQRRFGMILSRQRLCQPMFKPTGLQQRSLKMMGATNFLGLVGQSMLASAMTLRRPPRAWCKMGMRGERWVI